MILSYFLMNNIMNFRVALVRDGLIQLGIANKKLVHGPFPLKGLKILDVGCGGGILCEVIFKFNFMVKTLTQCFYNSLLLDLEQKL